jgi:hypothetical protein
MVDVPHADKKRGRSHRHVAPQRCEGGSPDAPRAPATIKFREASWSAPALWSSGDGRTLQINCLCAECLRSGQACLSSLHVRKLINGLSFTTHVFRGWGAGGIVAA